MISLESSEQSAVAHDTPNLDLSSRKVIQSLRSCEIGSLNWRGIETPQKGPKRHFETHMRMKNLRRVSVSPRNVTDHSSMECLTEPTEALTKAGS